MDTKKFHHQYGHCLGETSTEDFLTYYWQKKPLLIRNAFKDIQTPLSAEELAGLACEEQVNARIVLAEDGDKPWQVEFGPFDESRFSTLPESNWSLLVSDVEKHLPETQNILRPFRFIPDWRIDDLMISYAPNGGSVGAHTDAYDVFLLQLSGQRLWQISENFSDDILANTDLCILKNFVSEQEWLLNPGDMLYLPPNVAHYGVAQNNAITLNDTENDSEHCMTASIGFRAPSLKTVTSEYTHFLNTNVHDDSRYTDELKSIQNHHAEITDDTVNEFVDFLKQGLTFNTEHVKRWLGQYCSDNKAFENHFENTLDDQTNSYNELIALAANHVLLQSPYSHFLFSLHEKAALLFVNGLDYQVSEKFAEVLCKETEINLKQLNQIATENDKQVLCSLFNSGAIILSD